jgi:hypothetical protein
MAAAPGRLRDLDDYWRDRGLYGEGLDYNGVAMTDPEGNEFDIN